MREGTERHTECWCRHLKETDHLEDTDLDGKEILKSYVTETGRGGVYCIHLAQCLLKVVGSCENVDEHSGFRKKWRISRTTDALSASREGPPLHEVNACRNDPFTTEQERNEENHPARSNS